MFTNFQFFQFWHLLTVRYKFGFMSEIYSVEEMRLAAFSILSHYHPIFNPQMPKHRYTIYDEFSEEWSFIKWGRWHCIVLWIVKVKVTQSCLTLCDSMDCYLPDSSVHGVLQARTLEWVAIPFFRESSQPRDQTRISCIAGRFFTIWAIRKASLNST